MLANVAIADNHTTGFGGGLYNSGIVTMTNVTVYGNTAWRGGGVFNDALYPILNLANVTISANSATGSGGGIYNDGRIKLKNSIVVGNTAPAARDVARSLSPGGGLIPASDYNVIGALDAAYLVFAGTHTRYGSEANPLDAMLGSVTEVNGALCLPPLPGSPALNAGSNALAVDASGNPLLTDAAGQPRIAGGTVDIGAFEYQPQALSISGTDAKDTIELTSDDANFSYRINSDSAIKMPRSLVTALRIDAKGGDELSFDLDLQATDLLIQADAASRDQLLASICQSIASARNANPALERPGHHHLLGRRPARPGRHPQCR